MTEIDWSVTSCLSEKDGLGSFQSEVAVDSYGNVHVTWYDDHGGYNKIQYRVFLRQKNIWSDIQTISNNSAKALSYEPLITVDQKDRLHLCWWDCLDSMRLLYRYMIDNRWSEFFVVLQNGNVSAPYEIITNTNDSVLFFWNEQIGNSTELYYRSFSITTKEFSKVKQITNTSTYGPKPFSAICDSHQRIHLVWEDKSLKMTNYEIHYQYYENNEWQPDSPLILSQIDNISDVNPKLGIDSNDKLYLVWEHIDDSLEVYYQFEANDEWSESQKISGSGNAWAADIAIDKEDNFHVVYDENTWLIYKMKTINNEWSQPYNLTAYKSSFSLIFYPKVAVDRYRTIHIVWNDHTNTSAWEVYYIRGKIANDLLISKIQLFIVFSMEATGFLIIVLIFIKRLKR
ncbi:MAG TPA: hypothetical protein VMZ29_12100 [Candidatus Bathyarchaeia archaeon]|nr:hypothetical protein [Candidatus Bathyarchaeia archaeon]